jgi:hypothetical protein
MKIILQNKVEQGKEGRGGPVPYLSVLRQQKPLEGGWRRRLDMLPPTGICVFL